MREMKIQDLRVGNYYIGYDDRLHKIGLSDFKALNEIELDELIKEPGLVTRSWLLEKGFKSLNHFTVTNSLFRPIGRDRYICVGDIDNANQMVYLETIIDDKITDLVCVHNYDYDGRLYMHKFQNLYHAITGEEL